MSCKSKVNVIAVACLCAWATQHAHAQNAAAEVLRNIEQSKPTVNLGGAKSSSKTPQAPVTTDQGFARLKEIKVNSALFQNELMTYWLPEVNKPVPSQKLAEFKAYAWDLFQSKGYLAYITTTAQATAEGSILTVNVSMPTVGKVTVVTVEGNKGIEYADQVAKRFSDAYPTGSTVDVQGFEAQLNAIAYDLPVDLEVSMRQVNDKVVDVVVNLRPVQSSPLSVLGGVVQANNYGLQQFGRAQALGSVRIGGLTPLSELTLTSQLSTGVGYYRTDYEAPIQGTGTRWKVYGTQVRSKAINISGLSNELGAALTKLVSADRITRWYASAEASRGQSLNLSAGAETSDRFDDQLRIRLRSESSKGWFDTYTNEFLLTAGRMDLTRNSSDYGSDQQSNGLHVNGSYQKLEVRGGLSQALDSNRQVTGAARWRAQIASKNLDTGNRISLGGINGIRTLTSLDGVGDQAVQMSFDVTHQSQADVYAGLFYDVGVVKVNRNSIGTDNSSYTLQGAGYQIGGTIEKVNWTISVGKSFGKTPSSALWGATNSVIGDWRANISATYAF